jgi:hypothetical protein
MVWTYSVLTGGVEVHGNGWPLDKMNLVQTVAAATDAIRLGVDEVRVTYTSTAAVTDLEFPDSLLPYRVKALKIYDAGGAAGLNNITIKKTDNTVIAVIASDHGSVILSSDGTNIDVVSVA